MATARERLLQLAPVNSRIDRLAEAIEGMQAVRQVARRGETSVTLACDTVTAATGMSHEELRECAKLLKSLHGIRISLTAPNMDGSIWALLERPRYDVTIDWS